MKNRKHSGSAGQLMRIFIRFFTVSAVCLGLAVSAPAAPGDDLAKTADKLTRGAERSMFNGKLDEATAMIAEAGTSIEALKAAAPEHKKLKSIESKYARVKEQIDRKISQKAGSAGSPKAAPAAAAKSDSGKLPAGVTKRLKDIDALLNRAEASATSDAKNTAYKLSQAEELFAEIDKMYADQFDKADPDFAAVKARYDGLMVTADAQAAAEAGDKAGAEAAEAAKEKQSAEWVTKFRPYLSYSGQEGHDPDRVVFVPGTAEPEKFADAQKRYEAFKAFYEDYKKVAFPNGKTWALEDLADKEAPRRLAQFESEFADRMASVSGDAEKQLSDAMKQLDRDNGWKNDENIQPPIIDGKWMATIRDNVDRAATALGDDPKAGAMRKSYEELVVKDQANRKIRAERTLLFPDVYSGSDADDIKEAAEAIVGKEKPGSTILRISIYKDAWEEETVEEWTDTTKTKRRWRTTKKINAQVAARDSAGVFMHTLHIAKDKQSDGWSKLYGNIMFSDPMLESNVKKDGKRK